MCRLFCSLRNIFSSLNWQMQGAFYRYLHNLSAVMALVNITVFCIQSGSLRCRRVAWGCSAPRALQRAAWRSTMMGDGEQCVTTAGTWLRPRWCVVSSTSPEQNLSSLGRTTEEVGICFHSSSTRGQWNQMSWVGNCDSWGLTLTPQIQPSEWPSLNLSQS